jgi:two-component system NtrC family sensor kinase
VRDRLLVLKKPFDVIEVNQLARTLTAKWQATRQAESRIESLADALERLRRGEAALRRAHGELQVFTHSLAHDLRAPFTALGSFSQLLAGELRGRVEGKALHYLSRVQANARIGAEMIDQLLLLDRISQARLRPEPLEVGALARELVDELRRVHPERDVTLEVQGPLPAAADRELLRLALRLLLENAWKFNAGRARTRIQVGRQDGAAGATECFFVRDDGVGFATDDAGQLFQTFQRLHNDSAIPGVGAGLVIVNRIIERHDGRVWAEARPGAGATFYFTLGSAAAGAAAPPAPLAPGAAAGSRTTPTPIRAASSQALEPNQGPPSR